MRELIIKIRSLFTGKGEIDAATKSVADLGTEADKTSTLTGAFAGKIGSWLAGLASFTAAVKLAGRAMREFAAKQEAVASLDQALRNAGQATHAYRQELQALAGELQLATAIGDEAWYGVFETLTKFGSTPDKIREHTEAVKNLAGVTGMDIQSAAALFARAMQGNTSMLSRYGITVDDSLSKTEKLDALMQQLAARGAGILEAKAQTLSGQLQNLQNNIGDLLAAFAQMSSEAGALGAALDNINNVVLKFWIDRFSRAIPPVSDLTNTLTQQGRTAEEVAASHANLRAALDDMAKAQAAADAHTIRQITALQKQKRATDDLAAAERDLAIERVKNSDASEEEKASRIAEINRSFRDAELAAEAAHATEINRIRIDAAKDAAAELAAARAEAARLAAEAEAAEAASASEAARFAEARQLEAHLNNLIREREKIMARMSDLGGGPGIIGEIGRKTTEFKELERSLESTVAATNALRTKIKELSTDAGALRLAEEARAAADAADAQVAALEARAAELQRIAEETAKNSEEELALLTKKKDIEQQIADERERGAALRRAESEAARLAALAAKEEMAARRASAKAAADTRSELQKMFDAQRAYDQLSNREKMAVQRDMLKKYGLNPRNEDGTRFTPAQHFAGEKPADFFADSAPAPAPASPTADPQAPLTDASANLAESGSAISQTAAQLSEAAATFGSSTAEINSAAQAIGSAAENLKASLTELRSRIAALEKAAA
jgi:hypothetical protein